MSAKRRRPTGDFKIFRSGPGGADRFFDSNRCCVSATRHPLEYSSPDMDSCFTLQVVLEGEEEFQVSGRRYRIGPGRLLLIPPGETYTSHFLSGSVVKCPVFAATSVAREISVSSETEALDGSGLDGTEKEPSLGITLLPHDARLDLATRRLWRLTQEAEKTSSGPAAAPLESSYAMALESALLRLLGVALDLRQALPSRLSKLDAVRRSTRDEIHRRLALAEDRMRAEPGTDLSLGELARTSGMSSYHFLRRFTEFHGESPLRFLTGIRLSHAHRLLTGSDTPIKRVVRDCGYTSLTTFNALCRRAWGVPPGARRAGKGRSRRMVPRRLDRYARYARYALAS